MNPQMPKTKRPMGRRMAAMILLLALPLAGCATSMTQPVTDFQMVAGTWDGNYTYQAAEYGTETIGATWVINPDGTYEMSTRKWVAQGKMKLQDGNILFNAQPLTGSSYSSPVASGFASLQKARAGLFLASTGNVPGTHGTWTRAN
jgi:hypothetical protein